MRRATKQIDELIEELTQAAYTWGVTCANEGYSAHSRSVVIAEVRNDVCLRQQILYQYFLDLMDAQHE